MVEILQEELISIKKLISGKIIYINPNTNLLPMKKITLILSLFLFKISFSQSKLENLGSTINSTNSEIRPTLSADGKILYFVVEQSKSKKGKKKSINKQEVWFSSMNDDGTWAQAKKCSEPINRSKSHNAVFWSSTDGSQILIRGSYSNGKYIGRGFSFCKKTENGWSQPESLKIKGYNTLSVDEYDGAFLTNDGKTLLLYLSQEKNSWLNDLYVSQQQNENEWSFPQKIISDSISIDDYDEIAPYMAADGVTMYFSSDRPGGYGGYDIWMTKKLDDTWLHWTTPVNVGDSVNSDNWEAYFTLDAKAEYGYLATSRNSIGEIDICKIKLSENQKPKAVALLQGKVYNADNNQLISNVEITTEIEGSNNLIPLKIENEIFKTILPYGNKYIITAKGEGFELFTQTVDLSKLAPYQEMHNDIFLQPVKKVVPDSSITDSLNAIQNSMVEVLDSNVIDSKIKEEKKNKSQKSGKQKKEQDISAKSKSNSEKIKGKSQNEKSDVIENQVSIPTDEKGNSQKSKSKNNNLEGKNKNQKADSDKSAKSKSNSEKLKEKNRKEKVQGVDTEISILNDEKGNSQKSESENNNSEGKNRKQKNETDKSDSPKAIDINQAIKEDVEKGDIITVNNILFDFAKSSLKKTSYKELNKVVKLMKQNVAVKIELSAHTDNVGSAKYNLTLSKARAKSSRKYLISKGISSKRISSKGHGERKPIASNKTAKGRKQNRRVEIKVISSN